MKVSTKSRYGLRAMIYLAKQTGSDPVKRKEIARIEKIPPQYLENILLTLRKAGLIATQRGATGGFILTRTPDSIPLNEIIEALDGPMMPVDCAANPGICKTKKAECCEANYLWTRIYKAVHAILISMTLADLLNVRNQEWVI